MKTIARIVLALLDLWDALHAPPAPLPPVIILPHMTGSVEIVDPAARRL